MNKNKLPISSESEITLSKDFVKDIREIIEEGSHLAHSTVGHILLTTYWNIGRRIVEEEQQGNRRA